MRHRLRALERRLVFERAELATGRLVSHLLRRWEQAARENRSAPDALGLVGDLIAAGFYLPTGPRAIGYLEECARDNSVPRRERLLQILLPWNASAW